MVNNSHESKIKNIFSYFTQGQRLLFIVLILSLLPILFISSVNIISEQNPINTTEAIPSKFEIEIIDVLENCVRRQPKYYCWSVKYEHNGFNNILMLLIDGSNTLENDILSIGDLVWVEIDSTIRFYYSNIEGNRFQAYTVLEVKNGLFWNSQYTILKICFSITALISFPILRKLDETLLYDYFQQDLIENDSLLFINSNLCENCQQEYQTCQKYCVYCGSSLIRCLICYQKPEEHQTISILECCEMYAHTNHIIPWLKIKHQCPNCYSVNPRCKIINIFHN